MKLLAVVISYYPDVKEAVDNILRYISNIDKLIIWENTPEPDRNKYRIEIPEYANKIAHLSTGENEGIAYPLNRAAELGIADGFTHILTMDQDSYWENFDYYKNIVDKYHSQYKIFSPNVNYRYGLEREIQEIEAAITSGGIYDLTLFQEIGFFREDYFIDAVDTEFCFRAIKNSYPTICIKHAHLKQQFAAPTKFLGIPAPNYSAFRTYYITRNHIRLWKEYPQIISKKLKRFIIKNYIVKRFIQILLVENNKIKKIKAQSKGVRHGLSASKARHDSEF
ncbi:MAG: hypothetical protein LBG19_08935 [Prevotellaceae bacterium]|jgi:rhamnosyltransferase|nr:hypothetical protein [Prevotellaceae bacterium]